MTLAVSGTWNLHAAISQRWTEKGLDTLFLAEWPAPVDAGKLPLNWQEASPSTPVPFAIFSVENPVPLGHATGRVAGTEQQYSRVAVVFQVYAKRTASETAKAVAARMMALVAAAFDPGAGKWPMPVGSPDAIQQVRRTADWLQRIDDITAEAGLRFEIRIDSDFAR
jgi:hypothetical protein